MYSVQRNFPKWAKVLPEIKHIQRAQYRETGSFSYREYTDYILSQFGLLDVVNDPSTTDPVKVAVSFDGGSISRFLGHVTAGFKLVDKRCINPKTGEPLFGISGNEKVQSHIHCFPIKVAFAKDTKLLYQLEYSEFFSIFKAI